MALRLRGATSGYIELKAPASAGDNTLTLPTNNGSANQLLKTDGSGNLSWVDDNSGVSLSGSTNNTIATVTGANALTGEANLTFDGTTLKVSGASNTTQAVFSGTGGSGARGLEIVTESVGAADEGVIFNARASGTTGRLKFNTNGATAMTILGNGGNVGIGTTSPVGNLEVRGTKANLIVAKTGLTVKSTADLHSTYDFFQIGAGGALASYSTETATASTWLIHNAYRATDTNWKRRYADTACKIEMNSPGGEIEFFTAGNNSANTNITWTPTVQVKPDGDLNISDGDLVIGTSGHGIDFSATGDGSGTNSSELLDDYEEGTWLPIFTDDGTSGNSASSYAIRLGWYTKIGNLVNLQMRLSDIVFSSFNTGHATYIKNVPYVIQGSTNRLTTGSALLSNCNLDSDTMTVGVFANTSNGDHSYFRFVQTKDNTGWAAITIDQWTSGNNEILVNFSYRTG